MMPISKEKREILAAAKLWGEKEATIALWLGITVRPVAGVWKLYKTKGGVSPLKPKGRPSWAKRSSPRLQARPGRPRTQR